MMKKGCNKKSCNSDFLKTDSEARKSGLQRNNCCAWSCGNPFRKTGALVIDNLCVDLLLSRSCGKDTAPESEHIDEPQPGGMPPVHGPVYHRSASFGLMAVRRTNCAAAQNSHARETKNSACKAPYRLLLLEISPNRQECNTQSEANTEMTPNCSYHRGTTVWTKRHDVPCHGCGRKRK